MELEDLKSRWADYDRKLDTSLRLNITLLRESKLDKAATALRRLSIAIGIELVITAACALGTGTLMARHFAEPRFLIPAAMVHIALLVLAAANVFQLVTIREIDYDAPIVAIQKKLEQLRIVRIRVTKWALWLGPLLWTPMLIVLLALLHVDAYRLFPISWFVANGVFGIAFLLLMIWASRHWHPPFLKSILDDFAGRSLVKARRFVSEIAQFETNNGA